MTFFFEVLIGGLLAGVMYSLVALGFVLIYKASGVFNFAQGAMVFLAALTFVSILKMGVNFWLALAITLALGAAALVARAWPVSILVQSVVTMLGLGLGIDYALLVVSRFREAFASGHTADEGAELAARHAGHGGAAGCVRARRSVAEVDEPEGLRAQGGGKPIAAPGRPAAGSRPGAGGRAVGAARAGAGPGPGAPGGTHAVAARGRAAPLRWPRPSVRRTRRG